MKRFLNSFLKFIKNNPFVYVFVAAVFFVIVVVAYKVAFSKPTYIYAKVKMGQGLWWASTAKSPIWFVNSIKKGDVATDLLGNPIAVITSLRYYPWYTSNQYDVYMNLELKVTESKKTGTYSFNRSTIGVGSPIDLQFPGSQFSGTIIDLSTKPIVDQYVTKTIYMTKKYAYPWEYSAINIGDKYVDGEDTVFEIIDKSTTDSSDVYTTEQSQVQMPVVNPSTYDTRKYIIVKAKIKVKPIDGQFIYGEEQIVAPGRFLNVLTKNYSFTDYMISDVQ